MAEDFEDYRVQPLEAERMSEHLSEVEVADLESRVRYYREIGKVERDFCATIGEADRLLAERRALREALAALLDDETVCEADRKRARALLAPQKWSS